jgi:glycine/D-amino acid oxidase-like deaminating enzyme
MPERVVATTKFVVVDAGGVTSSTSALHLRRRGKRLALANLRTK